METPISGRAFWKSLPEEIRDRLPPRCRRIVIDIRRDDAVRILVERYATIGDEKLIEAALRAGYVEGTVETRDGEPSPE